VFTLSLLFLGISEFFILSVLTLIIIRFKTERENVAYFLKVCNISRRRAHFSWRRSASVPGTLYGICVGQCLAVVKVVLRILEVLVPVIICDAV
jgi:hypothetical protein